MYKVKKEKIETKTAKKQISKETPLNKSSKTLNKLQKEYMKEHSKKHSKEHNKEMIRLMKLGYCIEQSHKLAMKAIGK